MYSNAYNDPMLLKSGLFANVTDLRNTNSEWRSFYPEKVYFLWLQQRIQLTLAQMRPQDLRVMVTWEEARVLFLKQCISTLIFHQSKYTSESNQVKRTKLV